MNEYKKRVTTHAIYLCIIASLLVVLIPAVRASKQLETDKYKSTGISTNNGQTLQYDVDTHLVYTLGDFKYAGFERHPYINEDGITYKYNTNTKELYIEVKN